MPMSHTGDFYLSTERRGVKAEKEGTPAIVTGGGTEGGQRRGWERERGGGGGRKVEGE